MSLGPDDYREGALLRYDEAWALYEKEQWVGAIYLAGRSVEALFRCLLLREARPIAIGHNLREHLKRVGETSLLTDREFDSIETSVNNIAIVWRNELRYTGKLRMMRLLRDAGRHAWIDRMRVKGDPIKANARSVLEACANIITRGEPLCRPSKKS